MTTCLESRLVKHPPPARGLSSGGAKFRTDDGGARAGIPRRDDEDEDDDDDGQGDEEYV